MNVFFSLDVSLGFIYRISRMKGKEKGALYIFHHKAYIISPLPCALFHSPILRYLLYSLILLLSILPSKRHSHMKVRACLYPLHTSFPLSPPLLPPFPPPPLSIFLYPILRSFFASSNTLFHSLLLIGSLAYSSSLLPSRQLPIILQLSLQLFLIYHLQYPFSTLSCLQYRIQYTLIVRSWLVHLEQLKNCLS